MEIGVSEQPLPESGILRVWVTEDFTLAGGDLCEGEFPR